MRRSIPEILASLGAILAGVYLLTSETAAADSYLQVIAHGIGIYFIAKGIYMGRSLTYQRDQVDLLELLVDPTGGAEEDGPVVKETPPAPADGPRWWR